MQITELKNEGLDFQVKVVIPAEKITTNINKELADLSKKVKMAGFRAGKVPLSLIEKKYGGSVRNDVVQHEVSHTIQNIIKDKNLNIATDPRIEEFKAEENKDLEFTLKFELMPAISMPDFKKINLEKPVLKVEDKDIDENLKRLVEFSKSYTKESKGKAAKGDQVTIDAVGYVEGEAFEGGKLEAHKLVLGSKSFIDNFEDQLVGSKAGDEITVKVTFPENYHAKNLAGKPSEFKVKVLAVHKAEEPEINEEFAKKFGAKTVEELRQQVAKNIEANYAEPIHTMMKMRFFDQLEDMLDFDVPVSLLDREHSILKNQAKQVMETDPSLKDKSQEELENYYKKVSLRRVRIGLMLSEYVRLNQLKIEQKDIQNAVMAQARSFPGQERAVFDFYQKNPKALESLKGPILEEKAVAHIFDNQVKVIEKKLSQKDLEKQLEEESNRDTL